MRYRPRIDLDWKILKRSFKLSLVKKNQNYLLYPLSIKWVSFIFIQVIHKDASSFQYDKRYTDKLNKAGYTATLVACGWAGAVIEKVTGAFGQEQWAQNAQKCRKSKKGTDRPTDRRTDKAGCRVACTRLKRAISLKLGWDYKIALMAGIALG